jgi:hypothetical protein
VSAGTPKLSANCLVVGFAIGKLRSLVNGGKEVKLSFFGWHFGDVEMKETGRIRFECLFAEPVGLPGW